MHAEAEPMYLSNNLFHLPHNFAELPPFTLGSNEYETPPQRTILFSEAGLLRIRNVAFGMRRSDPTQLSVDKLCSALKDKLCHFAKGLDYAQVDFSATCKSNSCRVRRCIVRLAPEDLAVTMNCEGGKGNLRFTHDGIMYDVEVHEEKHGLRFRICSEQTVWDAYKL